MGLFHFGKKEPKKQPGLPQEEAARRWKDAYQANPQVYQKKDCDALLGSCTLSEGWILIRAMTHAELDGLFEGLPRQLA